MKSIQNRRMCAIVPLNIPEKSKSRLSRRLNKSQRYRLTITMLLNVLAALRKSRSVDDIAVVCADRNVASLVQEHGATFLWEGRRRGLNKALNFALRALSNQSSFLIIHADLPLLTAKDVDEIVLASEDHPLTLVPSKDTTGTNAMVMKVPGLIKFAFGKNSFIRHVNLAKKHGISYKILQIEGAAFDVDDEKDLDALTDLSRTEQRNRDNDTEFSSLHYLETKSVT